MEKRSQPQIIGGMFGLEVASKAEARTPPFLTARDLCLVNARSGISLLVKHLSPSQVWVPSYLCKVIVDAIDQDSTRLRFYEVNEKLEVTHDWMSSIRPRDLVIFIDYFGFPSDSASMIRAKDRGALVLEDACLALLSDGVGAFSDFVLFSPRKFVGVPDGGILRVNCDIEFANISLKKPPSEWWLKAFSASILRREFDVHGGDRSWFEINREIERTCPIGAVAMSELSATILDGGIDYAVNAQRRTENYEHLARGLERVAFFPNLTQGVVPLGMPIRVKNRARIRQALFDHQIYPSILWPITDVVPDRFKDSHLLAEELLTLPCDQRYDIADMERMLGIICHELEK